ncbi:MAG TPA: 2-phospho-L-lactate transferase CofD family protein, partial [Vicinamibacterales bacterium]|nr:2-phospho-L-lactate transferase CofD family protein [Vicinamibacterales bacterium]
VVLFSGGRGSAALSRQLVSSAGVDLTIVINGYDDGASTGEVRRFLGDSLGPSDFRKNASNLADALRSCPPALIEFLDLRMPSPYTTAAATAVIAGDRGADAGRDAFADRAARLREAIPAPARAAASAALRRFAEEVERSGKRFDFSDCSLGNLVFAGAFLLADRRFNETIDDYCRLLGLPAGLIENVTDGTNAHLVAIEANGHLLATEAAIVDAARPNSIRDIFLLDRPLTDDERAQVERGDAAAENVLSARAPALAMNPRIVAKIAAADLIIYGPGTQHSSLFPSYVTPGLGDAIASNLTAMKVLVTNIQPDAEITGSNAVDLVDKAVFYLKAKGSAHIPTPFLITHSLLNDPSVPEASRPYVPLGPTDTIEDPRLVRIGNYEEGLTGRHHAARVLEPFIASIVSRRDRRRVAVLLTDTDSLNKVTQTLLEMVRGGIAHVPLDVTVFHSAREPLDARLAARLPFEVRHLRDGERSFAAAARDGGFEYVLLFESSGMYRGEETVPLLTPLATGRLDAVWGSRRLSLRDIEESYRFRYSASTVGGAISYLGSHALSLACLLFYGRYVSDTLSGVRAIRAADVFDPRVDLAHKNANHVLLSRLLRRKAEILEIPVRFVPLSPERVKRTSPLDGVNALATLVTHRFIARPAAPPSSAYAPKSAAAERPVK